MAEWIDLDFKNKLILNLGCTTLKLESLVTKSSVPPKLETVISSLADCQSVKLNFEKIPIVSLIRVY